MRTTLRLKNVCLAAALLAACALGLTGTRASASETRTAARDDAAIRENVRTLEEGWNRKSGELFARAFAEDADYVVINGMHIRGRAQIAASHQRIFDTFYEESTVSFKVEQVRMLRADVALVHVAAHLTRPGGDRDARITLIMTREGATWSIAAFQNTLVEARR